MRNPKIKVIIEPDLEIPVAGLYKIQFSNGYYYIGCSKNIKSRIKQHLMAINHDFAYKGMAAPLQKMKGFKGTVTFSLVLWTDSSTLARFGVCPKLVALETEYIRSNNTDRKMLNLVAAGFYSAGHYGQKWNVKHYGTTRRINKLAL